MTENQFQTRRTALMTGIIAASAFSTAASARATPPAEAPRCGPELDARRCDWDWLVGRWNVRHRRLKARLAGSTEWEEFAGTSVMWLTLAGLGTVDDNVLELPGGTYRAVGIRAYDPANRQWSIWWLDARYPTRIDPPVHGGFRDGEGLSSATMC